MSRARGSWRSKRARAAALQHSSWFKKGEALSGSYKGQLGEAQVTGTVKGDEVTIEYKVEGQRQSLAVKYSGKTDGKTMSGNVSLGQLGEGTFTGKKQ
jgi:hypothetical protein